MKRSTQTWSEYLSNKNATKNPKTFNLTVQRNHHGEYELVGGGSFMKHNMGGKSEWVQVDVRDLARDIRNNGINAR